MNDWHILLFCCNKCSSCLKFKNTVQTLYLPLANSFLIFCASTRLLTRKILILEDIPALNSYPIHHFKIQYLPHIHSHAHFFIPSPRRMDSFAGPCPSVKSSMFDRCTVPCSSRNGSSDIVFASTIRSKEKPARSTGDNTQ